MKRLWVIFTTALGKEKAAQGQLRDYGYESAVPLLPWKTRNGPEGRKPQRPPAIPRFVFVLLGEDWRAIRSVLLCDDLNKRGRPTGEKCVSGVFRVAGEVAKVSQVEMEAFMTFLAGFKEPAKQVVKAGDSVRVAYGAFEDKIALVEAIHGEKLNLLMGLFKVSVKADQVELVTQPEKNAAKASKQLQKGANHTTGLSRDGGRSAAGGKSRIDPERPRTNIG